MMKRFLPRMLAFCLCLCLSASVALAADADVMPPAEDGSYRYIENMMAVGDSLIIVTREGSEMQLWRWTEDMPQAELYAAGLTNVRYLGGGEYVSGTAGGFAWIFTDGEKLYGLNNRESTVFTIEVEDGRAKGVKLCELGNMDPLCRERDNWDSFITPISTMVVGDKLVWHSMDMVNKYTEQVVIYDLTTGYVKQAVTHDVQIVTPYKDNQVLMITGGSSGRQTVYSYDVVTDAMNYLGDIPAIDLRDYMGDVPAIDSRCNAVYHPEMELLMYQDDSCIMGWSTDGTIRQVGFIPTLDAGDIALVGDSVVHATTSEIVARTVTENYTAGRCLRLLNGKMNDVFGHFTSKFQNVPFSYIGTDAETDIRTCMTRDENRADLVFTNVADGEYLSLRDEGYLLDLAAYPELLAYAQSLYPAFRDLVMEDGALYAIPFYADSYNGWFINKAVMEDMGLTAEDIPTSLTELMAFATRWSSEFVSQYPQYTLLNNTEDYRERFLNAILNEWAGYCQAKGQSLTLDDPLFRELLAALEAMDVSALDENLKQTDPEKSEYKQALIWTGCKLVGNWATYMEDFSDRVFIPLTLTPETEYTVGVNDVSLWTVNALSDNADLAAALLVEKINNLTASAAYVLQTTATEPVVSDTYAQKLEYAEEMLQRMQDSVEESVSKSAAEARVAEYETYINTELKRQMYEICPSAIENYVNVLAPAMYIRHPGVLTGNSREETAANLVNRYIRGTISAEDFITRMEAWLADQP